MEFKITKEFIIEAHNAACSDWKERIESEFPEAFKTELEIGKWYKSGTGMLFQFAGKYSRSTDSGSFGFNAAGMWVENIGVALDGLTAYNEATLEEIESALIAEAKKRGYKKGVTCVFGSAKDKRQLGTDCFFLENNNLCVKKKDSDNADIIFKDGKWAEILPTEKTVITVEKALKILAKKLKVSPENIEIEC